VFCIQSSMYHLLGAYFLLSGHNVFNQVVGQLLRKADLPENNDCDAAYERAYSLCA
jgi:hypothetical protein